MKWLFFAFFTAFLFLFSGKSTAQSSATNSESVYYPKYKIEKYSLESGLSNPRVKCLLEHSSGFLYVGTEFGLNRFDGYEFTVFDNTYLSTPRLSGANVNRLKEIWDGQILITYGRGRDSFDVFNPHTLSLQVVSTKPESGFQGVLVGVTVDEVRNPYLLSYTPDGLHLYALERNLSLKKIAYIAQPMDFTKVNLSSIEFFRFRAQKLENETIFWVSNKIFGLLKIKIQAGVPAVTLVHPPLHIRWKPYLWELDKAGKLHMEEPFAHLVYSSPQHSNTLQKQETDWYACFGHIDESNNWLLAGAKGRVLEQYEKGDGFRILLENGREMELPYPFVFDWNTQLLFSSRNFEQYIWVGTFDGLRKVTLQSSKVNQLFAKNVADGVYGSRMRGIGGNAQGNKIFLPETGPAYFQRGSDIISEIPEKWSTGRMVTVDDGGNFWCSGLIDVYGLARLDANGQKWTYYAKGSSYSVHWQTRSGKILAALIAREMEGKGGGIEIVDPNTGQVNLFKTADQINPFEKITPNYILETWDGQIWVATSKGLFQINLDNSTCQKFSGGNQSRSVWENPDINIMLEMPDGKLMLGSTMGLIILDSKTGDARTYSRNDGLCNNLICGILPGENGNYWISTYNGLSCFNYPDQTFRNYYVEDGLTHNEFNRYSFFKARDGQYYFGGMNGVSVFSEKDLLPVVEETGMFISELSFFKDNAFQNFKVWDPAQAIILPAENRYLSVKVGAFDMTNAAENVFAYRIEGLDKDWVMMGNQHEFRFPLLPAGQYTLRIKSAPPNGSWSSKELAIPLIVKEYWYKTWWAYVLYLLCVAGMLWLGWSFQKRRLKMEHENQHLKEVDGFKSRFFTNITHEFRTPLTVILGVSEQIEGQVPSVDLKSKLGLIRRNGQNLLRLINEILDLAKLESHSLNIQYVQGDILAYLRYIAESLHSLSNSQNVMLRVESRESSIWMDYDPDRILQVVHNLLSNAIKFTPSGGRVVLQAEIHAGNLQLTVTDTGAGIPEEELPRIFDRFYQAKNQEHVSPSLSGRAGAGVGGTGIGLSLTRELVRAMGGEISVESTLGKGSRFTVTMPIKNEASALEMPKMPDWEKSQPLFDPPMAEEASHDGLPRILIIEDNPDVVEYLGFCLGNTYQTEYAFNGRAGIEKALELVPDIIISDVMMPEKDGFEVCDTLKNDSRTSHIPIVLLTAKADANSRIAGLRRGADAYLSKPFHQEELMVQLQNLLELRNKMRTYYAGKHLDDQPGPTVPTNDMEEQFLQKLRELINQNLANPKLSQDFICQQMGMSRTNLYRKLIALTNLPLTLFIRDLRLQKARQLLQTTKMNVSEVAYECGFDDPKYFSRVFSEVFGVPPSHFRP
ncbi:MAG TPA: ATP-binding protein [Saprospiraceae bacterium]|nr:ATP-binding protein [Saprospiraceae bacterium]